MSILYQALGEVSEARSNFVAARAWFERDLAITTYYAKRDDTRLLWQIDLISSLERLARLEGNRKNFDAAIAIQSEALEQAALLAAQEPSNPQWQLDQALLYEGMERFHAGSKDWSAALTDLKQALSLFQRGTRDISASRAFLNLIILES